MIHKWIATSTQVGAVIMLVVAAMAWQVSPALAGFTPPAPVDTPVGPVDTPVGPVDTPVGPVNTPHAPHYTPPAKDNSPQGGTPEMPVTGGQLNGLDRNELFLVLLAGIIILLFTVFSLFIRQSTRTKTDK